MSERRTVDIQRAFAAHLRDPAQQPYAVDDERRLQIYRDLFYNNVEDCLSSAFPVLRSLSTDAVWHARVRAFYAGHASPAPQFHHLPEQFLRYLEARDVHPDDPPYLGELAHYEWVELALSVSPEELPTGIDVAGDLIDRVPVLSPLAWLLAYDWPVHRIGRDFVPDAPGATPTYLVVNRDRDDRVRFLEINAVTARLMQLIEATPAATGRELLSRLAAELGMSDIDAVMAEGQRMLAQLAARDIVLGAR